MQGVIKSYDPGTGDGIVIRETDFAEFDLAEGALDGSVFRMLRQQCFFLEKLKKKSAASRTFF